MLDEVARWIGYAVIGAAATAVLAIVVIFVILWPLEHQYTRLKAVMGAPEAREAIRRLTQQIKREKRR